MHVRDAEVFLLHDNYVWVRLTTTGDVVGWGPTSDEDVIGRQPRPSR